MTNDVIYLLRTISFMLALLSLLILYFNNIFGHFMPFSVGQYDEQGKRHEEFHATMSLARSE